MPVAQVNGVNIVYHVKGEAGPWLALTPGGRRSHHEFVALAEKIAAKGFRVLLHDRRNTGASDIRIAGEDSEEEIWADDLYALLGQLDARPAFISGSSSGARMSMLFALRHREAARGLLLFRVTGGEFPAGRLPQQYYGQFIAAARTGGMEAVCAMPDYAERLKGNPANRAYLMSLDRDDYIAVMSRWLEHFTRHAHEPVMGVTKAQLASLTMPVLIVPGNDRIHSLSSGLAAHERIPGSILHRLPIEDTQIDLIPFEDWANQEDEIAEVFAAFMTRAMQTSS